MSAEPFSRTKVGRFLRMWTRNVEGKVGGGGPSFLDRAFCRRGGTTENITE